MSGNFSAAKLVYSNYASVDRLGSSVYTVFRDYSLPSRLRGGSKKGADMITDVFFDSLRTWAEVDLDIIKNNHEALRRLLPKNVKTAAVVKADGYGHGAIRIARLLQNKTEYFAVAMPDEAVQLRQDGIENPILILGHTFPLDYPRLLRYDIETSVSTKEEAEAMSEYACGAGGKIGVHIAVDTGMSRIGFSCDIASESEIIELSKLEGIELRGIFSHYAAADSSDLTYTELQTDRFLKITESLERKGVHIPCRHLCNSAGIALGGEKFDMVREGILLYGLMPSDELDASMLGDLKPAMALKSHVSNLRRLEAGVPVSYGCTFVTKRESIIATIQAGYADGVPRSLSNNCEVIIRGKRAPIAGRVCMDQTMIDVTDVPGVKVGDTATIFGTDGDETITADDVASAAHTIGYEIICGISKRVPRVYVSGGRVSGITRALPYA